MRPGDSARRENANGMTAAGSPEAERHGRRTVDLAEAAKMPAEEVLRAVGSSNAGLSSTEARARLERVGPNALRSHGPGAIAVLVAQLRNPFLLLLLATAAASAFFGERTDAIIIFLISGLSVGLGFVSEYRSTRAVEALHSQLRHTIVAVREGAPAVVDVTELVPGDVVRVGVGDVVPADLRLLEAEGLECDESVLTGESAPAEKDVEPVAKPESPLELPSCAFMGTVVGAGSGVGVVVQTGGRAEFGRIATQLGERQPQTAFQLDLRDFSILLVRFAGVLSVTILVVNVALGRPVIESLLFALSISIGLTPQLLPAIVSVSLSTGARRLAQRKVIVKRLVAIEDFGNIEVFFTDKTGTLTEGRIRFEAALDSTGADDEAVFRDGLLCSDVVVDDTGAVVRGTALDQALWAAPGAQTIGLASYRRLAARPFDYERRIASVLVEGPEETRTVIVKGAPELVLARCGEVPPEAQPVLDAQFERGSRAVAVATRDARGKTTLSARDEAGSSLPDS
jgi:P-type Mg2+ transporter